MIVQSFSVIGQQIMRTNSMSLVADSHNLISFEFSFSPHWEGVSKTAIITTGGATYNAIIGANGAILAANMPVLRAGECTVSVFGGDLYTVGACSFAVYESGLKGGATPQPPPPELYNQILNAADNANAHAQAAENLANDIQSKAAQEARKSADSATLSQSSATAAEKSNQAAIGSAAAAASVVSGFDAHAAIKNTEFNAHAAAKTKQVTDEGAKQVGIVAAEGAKQVGIVAAEGAKQVELAKIEADKAAADAGKTAADRIVVESAAGAETGRVAAEQARANAENARATDEAARKIAEGNRAAEETGRKNAESLRESTTAGIVVRATAQATIATEQATLAAGKATAAGTSAAEAATSAKRADDIVKSITLNKYSVRFSGASPIGIREDSAIGMVANVAVGGARVVNDFDNISFFNRPICCCTRSVAAKSGWIINAYRGEPGFAADGTNGEVMYECKPFYYKASPDLTYVSVAATPMEGYELAPMFKNAETKVYCPSYWIGSVGGKATSRSGDTPIYGGSNSLMAQARTFDAAACLEPISVRFSDYLLQLVEFANRNLKAIMAGAQVMRYNGELDKITAIVSPTAFTTTALVGGYFVDGQSISIGSARNGSDRSENVKIISIATAGNISTFTLARPVATMVAGDFISTRCWQNGATDIVAASSGSPGSNKDGRYPCIWRGKVDPWAHLFSTLADILVKCEGLGTTESPYTYISYFLPDATKYANGVITSDYVRCNTVIPPTSGYVKSLACDSRYSAAFAPSELGAASNTYASAYFYNYGYEVAGLLAGGSWSYGGVCSPVYFYCFPPSDSSFSVSGRLFVLPA